MFAALNFQPGYKLPRKSLFTVCPLAAAGIRLYLPCVFYMADMPKFFFTFWHFSSILGCGIYAVFPINRKARISVNLKQHICDMQFNAVAVTLSQFSKIVPIKTAYLRYAVCGCCLCIKNANCYKKLNCDIVVIEEDFCNE